MIFSKLSLFCASVLILLGAFTLVAWVTSNITLIQIRPTLVPMSIPTALGFVVSGLGLIFLDCCFLRTAQVFGAMTLILGGLNLIVFLLPKNTFDDLSLSFATEVFHQMPPNTSLCFYVSGFGFPSCDKHPLHLQGHSDFGSVGFTYFRSWFRRAICALD